MSAQHIEGAAIAQKIRGTLAAGFLNNPLKPHLAAIMVGEHGANKAYFDNLIKSAAEMGIKVSPVLLPANTSEDALRDAISKLNGDSGVHGIFLLVPLPGALNEPDARSRIINIIDPGKDVDGLTQTNQQKLIKGDATGFVPGTAWAVTHLIRHTLGDNIRGKKVAMIGMSDVVGRPVTHLLRQQGCDVTGFSATVEPSRPVRLHQHRWDANEESTKTITAAEQKAQVGQADIVVVAIGNPNRIVTGEWIKPGATVIDVGVNVVGGQTWGDTDYNSIKEVAGHVTREKGSVTPMTRTGVLQNTVQAYMRQMSLGKESVVQQDSTWAGATRGGIPRPLGEHTERSADQAR